MDTSKAQIKELTKRLGEVEKRLEKAQFGKKKREGPPRKPSEYNIFVKKFLAANKDPNKSHAELFKEASAKWSAEKADKADKASEK